MKNVISFKPNIQFIQRTESVRQSSDIAYSDSSIQYNSSTVSYGGLGNSLYPAPINIIALGAVPNMQIVFQPTTTSGTRVLSQGMPMGPGFFLYITYPTSSTITI